MPKVKKQNKSISTQPKSHTKRAELLVDNTDEMFSGGIILDLPKIFKYKVK